MREMHAACLAAIEAGRQALRPGVTGSEVYHACRAVLAERGWADRFPHHAGHGIGLGHPEPPYLVPESTEVLQAGDVVTLEPGLYLPGVGGMRYEHNYVVNPTGCEQLTQHSLSLTQ
jgi:Xaa-Pro aminopeptidase